MKLTAAVGGEPEREIVRSLEFDRSLDRGTTRAVVDGVEHTRNIKVWAEWEGERFLIVDLPADELKGWTF